MWHVECGQAIDRQTLAHVRPPAVTKSPNFWAGTPPPPFQYTIHLTFKSCMAHSGARWVLCRARFATKTIFQGAPLPTEHSKITIVHGIGCSLDLSISYHCFFVFGEYGCGLSSVGKQSIDKLCRMSGHLLLQKARTFGLGSPPPAPSKHNRFQYNMRCHLT